MVPRPAGVPAVLVALLAVTLACTLARPASAQEPDTIPAPPAAAEPDTLDTLEEIEARLMGELGEADSTPAGARETRATAVGSLNPDLSLISDFVADLSPDESTLEEGDRFQLREIELGVQGAVDPYFRYDAFLAVHGGELEIEEAYATTLALPAGLQVRVGRFRLPFGKVNLTHVPELDTIDLPLLHQEFFGEEGLASTGVWLSLFGAPLGFPQEISFLATNGAAAHAHAEEGHEEDAPEEHDHEEAGSEVVQEEEPEGEGLFDDLADRLWLAHLVNSLDLTPAANLELGASYGTSVQEPPEEEPDEPGGRTNLVGLDATFRWKPLARAKYRSAILQAEVAWRREVAREEPRFGAFVFGQWQLARRWYVGGRVDVVELVEAEDETLRAGQVLVRWFPTEFSQIRLAWERQDPEEGNALDRLLLQTTFALGPHRPHAF